MNLILGVCQVTLAGDEPKMFLQNQHICWSLNSQLFPVFEDKLINPTVGVYLPIIGFRIKVGMTIPNVRILDPGTYQKAHTHYSIQEIFRGEHVFHGISPVIFSTPISLPARSVFHGRAAKKDLAFGDRQGMVP